MILDIARHKFYEGALYLFIVTILSVVIAFVGVDNNIANATIAAAPLQPAMRDFMLMHPVWSAVIAAMIIMTTSMRMTRTTIIHSLFSVGTLATMSLSAVIMMGVGMHGNILSTLMVGFLLSEAINRAGYCVNPEPTLHYMFTACMALGAMPLFDCSMLAPAIVAPLLLLLSNKKPREILVAYIGLLVPLFAYSYIQWCQGHPMLECAKQLWEGMLTPSALADVDYLSIPRLVMLGIVMFMQICTSLIYFNDRLSISLSARQIWRQLQILVLLLTTCFILLPSTTPASFMSIGLCISLMAPLLFFKIEGVGSMIAFYVLLGIALWAI